MSTALRGRNDLVRAARASRYLARVDGCAGVVNLAGDYDYLNLPYYVSQDLEAAGDEVRPTCKQMLDAYVPPLFLERARLAGLAVPEYYISNGYFEPPVIVDPVNPFTLKGRLVNKPERATSAAKSLTRNYTYAICCQEIPPESKIVYFRQVLGWCGPARYRPVAQSVWEVFGIPLAKVRLIIAADGTPLLSDMSPLPLETLGRREQAWLQERVEWVR